MDGKQEDLHAFTADGISTSFRDFLYRIPPRRFISTQMTAGLKELHKRINSSKENCSIAIDNKDVEGEEFIPSLGSHLASRYKVLEIIGKGQSGVLVRAEDTFHAMGKEVAIKVLHTSYSNLGPQEASCLLHIKQSDSLKVANIIEILNVFTIGQHYCMVFELLRPRPLYEHFQKWPFFSKADKIQLIRRIAFQVVQALGFLSSINVIHADIKPENILFTNDDGNQVKVVDFGNALYHVHDEISLYFDEFDLQTIIYRAPEVMFGLPFGPAIDMWSLGCVLAEFYLGEPIFLGRMREEILEKMQSLLGPLPVRPFQAGKFYSPFKRFVSRNSTSAPENVTVNILKRLGTTNYVFADFIAKLLAYDPSTRLDPFRALVHPFLASECALGHFVSPNLQTRASDQEHNYPAVMLTSSSYVYRPKMNEKVKQFHYSSLQLLRIGCTAAGRSSQDDRNAVEGNIARVSPFVTQTSSGTEPAAAAAADTVASGRGEHVTRPLEENANLPAKQHSSASPIRNTRPSVPSQNVNTSLSITEENINQSVQDHGASSIIERTTSLTHSSSCSISQRDMRLNVSGEHSSSTSSTERNTREATDNSQILPITKRNTRLSESTHNHGESYIIERNTSTGSIFEENTRPSVSIENSSTTSNTEENANLSSRHHSTSSIIEGNTSLHPKRRKISKLDTNVSAQESSTSSSITEGNTNLPAKHHSTSSITEGNTNLPAKHHSTSSITKGNTNLPAKHHSTSSITEGNTNFPDKHHSTSSITEGNTNFPDKHHSTSSITEGNTNFPDKHHSTSSITEGNTSLHPKRRPISKPDTSVYEQESSTSSFITEGGTNRCVQQHCDIIKGTTCLHPIKGSMLKRNTLLSVAIQDFNTIGENTDRSVQQHGAGSITEGNTSSHPKRRSTSKENNKHSDKHPSTTSTTDDNTGLSSSTASPNTSVSALTSEWNTCSHPKRRSTSKQNTRLNVSAENTSTTSDTAENINMSARNHSASSIKWNTSLHSRRRSTSKRNTGLNVAAENTSETSDLKPVLHAKLDKRKWKKKARKWKVGSGFHDSSRNESSSTTSRNAGDDEGLWASPIQKRSGSTELHYTKSQIFAAEKSSAVPSSSSKRFHRKHNRSLSIENSSEGVSLVEEFLKDEEKGGRLYCHNMPSKLSQRETNALSHSSGPSEVKRYRKNFNSVISPLQTSKLEDMSLSDDSIFCTKPSKLKRRQSNNSALLALPKKENTSLNEDFNFDMELTLNMSPNDVKSSSQKLFSRVKHRYRSSNSALLASFARDRDTSLNEDWDFFTEPTLGMPTSAVSVESSSTMKQEMASSVPAEADSTSWLPGDRELGDVLTSGSLVQKKQIRRPPGLSYIYKLSKRSGIEAKNHKESVQSDTMQDTEDMSGSSDTEDYEVLLL